jgi:hypothetical protein
MIDMDATEREIVRIEAGDAWQESDEVVQVDVNRPLDRVVPVRLPSDTWEELRREATALGVGPTTLVRMWVKDKLRERRTVGRSA